MPATFDGENLIITLELGKSTLDAKVDLYSDWKEWLKTGDNAKYPLAFRTIAGDPVTVELEAAPYFFIRNDNGWRIRPAEADATISVVGNLVPEDLTLPVVVPTLGGYTVLVLGLQPVTQQVTGIAEAVWDQALTAVAAGSTGEALILLQRFKGLDSANPMVSVKTPGTITQSSGGTTVTHVESPTDTVTSTRS